MKPLTAAQLENHLHALFVERLDDATLRDRIQPLTGNPHFRSLVAVWGPPLYRRNRVMFLPFITSHMWVSWYGYAARWNGPYREALEQWLAEADRLDDVELFRALYTWKHLSFYWRPRLHWQRDLVTRFRSAPPMERAAVLVKYDISQPLDEDTAIALYEIDPIVMRDRIAFHGVQGGNQRLMELIQRCGDDALYWQLYRTTIPGKHWRTEVLALADRVSDPAELLAELEKRHPGYQAYNHFGVVFLELARRRGEAVLPYLRQHLRGHYRGNEAWYRSLRELARTRGWTEFETLLVRQCGSNEEFQQSVTRAVADETAPEEQIVRQLYDLTGISDPTTIRYLPDAAAVAVYRRFPELIRGSFRPVVHVPWQGGTSGLLAEVLAAGDEELIDHLAAQVVPRATSDRMASALADHYAALSDHPAEFARRAVSVLTRLQTYSFSEAGYQHLIQANRLSRLLLARSSELHLEEPGLLRDLLEAPCLHVQVLALRILARDDVRAREAAVVNLDLLLPMLLRNLHRRTRLMAFRALANAGTTELHARHILARAREAMEIPDPGYPREGLIGLIGRLLARHPALRGRREEPIVYARAT